MNVLVMMCQPSESTLETGEGFSEKDLFEMFTRSSFTTRLQCSNTVSAVSPGRIRKLTTALARFARTLSLVPALNIVGAVVVLITAFNDGDLSITSTFRKVKYTYMQ